MRLPRRLGVAHPEPDPGPNHDPDKLSYNLDAHNYDAIPVGPLSRKTSHSDEKKIPLNENAGMGKVGEESPARILIIEVRFLDANRSPTASPTNCGDPSNACDLG